MYSYCFRSLFRKNNVSNKSSYHPHTRITRYHTAAQVSNGSPTDANNEIKWLNIDSNKQSDSGNKQSCKEKAFKKIIEIPLFPCDDYVEAL